MTNLAVVNQGTIPSVTWGTGAGVELFPFQSGVNSLLYQWGPIQFQIQPVNVNEADHETASDWAHKEIAGAAVYREWVGENDETIYLRGDLFPYKIGGLSEIELFDAQRRDGIANMLVRGDGTIMGWFVCEKLVRTHTWLGGYGVGQKVHFEAVMTRIPIPNSSQFLSSLWGAGLVE